MSIVTASTGSKVDWRPAASVPCDEAPAWSATGGGWKHLFGSFHKLGVSFEWHDFETARELDWGKSFHPGSLEICLNLSGAGRVEVGRAKAEYAAHSAGFYRQGDTPLKASRPAGERHQFITVEYSNAFMREHFTRHQADLHPLAAAALNREAKASGVVQPRRLSSEQMQLIWSLRHPPVLSSAQQLWYESKALELAAFFFFGAGDKSEMFCDRQKRLGQERTERVIAVLRGNLASPPGLEDLGKEIGCSPFYLSRTFSKETGMTIPQFTRKLRMERAAELLKSGKFNVTEAALEVGYSSLSHFSQAFHEAFGCCPGLFPILKKS